MSDIFISYRHGVTDSLIAGRLNDFLRLHFDVFLDTDRKSNDYGDDFAERIDDELSTCRVMFAVIGPDWASQRGLQRLGQENDWVRHELRAALAQDGIRIIPLFLGPDAAPALAGLPQEWRALSTKVGRPLNPDLWDAEMEDLKTRLSRDWLAVRQGPSRTPAIAVPPVLPYLCDRSEQEEKFIEMVEDARPTHEPIACVVHGYRDEAHDELLDRLRHAGVLEQILGADDVGTITTPIQVSRAPLREGRFADALKNGLRAGLNCRRASDQELRALLINRAQPLLVIAQFTWSDYEEIGDTLLAGLVAAWKSLTREGVLEGAELPRPAYPLVLWINLTYDDVDIELADAVLGQPLPKLKPVEERHVREWVGLPQVRPLVAHKKDELLDLPDDARYYFTPGKVHMRRFADAVRTIIASP
jgi:hypothetical protein